MESVLLNYMDVFRYIYFVDMEKILKCSLSTLYDSFKINLRNITDNDIFSTEPMYNKKIEMLIKSFLDTSFVRYKIINMKNIAYKPINLPNVYSTDWFIRQSIEKINRDYYEKKMTKEIIELGEYFHENIFSKISYSLPDIILTAKNIINNLFFENDSIFIAPPLTYAVVKYILNHLSTRK